uniref:Reverse transcriptase zinc-binding domain-containing protein n=1 Tax=Aegilops tauschii subsp. strangulata TaxID=200361 RepID=A0A453PUQ8_AEGTS
FFNRTKFIVGNGTDTSFWEDTWLGETPLALQYPTLYNIVQRATRLWQQYFSPPLLIFNSGER